MSFAQASPLRRRLSDLDDAPPSLVRDEGLAEAIDGDHLALAFQPIFRLDDGRVAGVEALARLDGASPGSALFRRAAGAGLSERLSRHLQRKILAEVGAWTGALAGLKVAINVLPDDIARPGYVDWLLALIADAGVDPARLTIELTEHAALADLAAVRARLERLRAAGVTIALDDFGSGYASLAQLISLPLDSIKIDRTLVAPIEHAEPARVLLAAVLDLARKLDMTTVVEGVESAGQLALLRQLGGAFYQGYLGARPMDSRALARFLAERT